MGQPEAEPEEEKGRVQHMGIGRAWLILCCRRLAKVTPSPACALMLVPHRLRRPAGHETRRGSEKVRLDRHGPLRGPRDDRRGLSRQSSRFLVTRRKGRLIRCGGYHGFPPSREMTSGCGSAASGIIALNFDPCPFPLPQRGGGFAGARRARILVLLPRLVLPHPGITPPWYYPALGKGRKNRAMSAASAAGCSMAAKWPPFSITVHWRISV